MGSNDNNSGPELEAYSHGVYLSAPGSALYFFNTANVQLLEIDVATGNKREIAGGITGSTSGQADDHKGMDYHKASDVIYIVGGDGEAEFGLYAVEPVRGAKALISR